MNGELETAGGESEIFQGISNAVDMSDNNKIVFSPIVDKVNSEELVHPLMNLLMNKINEYGNVYLKSGMILCDMQIIQLAQTYHDHSVESAFI